jgi:hypothetical protein
MRTFELSGFSTLLCDRQREQVGMLDKQLKLTRFRDWVICRPLANSPAANVEFAGKFGVGFYAELSHYFCFGHAHDGGV